MKHILLICFAVFLAIPALAENACFQWIGNTNSTVTLPNTWHGMIQACRDTYGMQHPAVRVCSRTELLNTIVMPMLPQAQSGMMYDDLSGPEDACGGSDGQEWQSLSGKVYTVLPDGTVDSLECGEDTSGQGVACCAPISLPLPLSEAPSSMGLGIGALALFVAHNVRNI